ncbi:cupin domain-containing protein [Kiloniella antarctica]|uniref:Cupin domain-containing protein n=1 Tax=Kiloniella antarctica TaxID=1550907 RepID=A0ABW5BG98_9PROT
MRSLLILLTTVLIFMAELAPNTTMAHGNDNKNRRQLLLKETLTNVPGHNLTAITVELAPGNVSPAHEHNGFVFVYVLSGKVRSQLGNAQAVDYVTGDSWVEPPGVVHTLTQNLSDKEVAKLLAVFVHKSGSKLTTSGEIEQ